jgi:NAD(P)-dependent dehydrogenase (short-subunit alcohol dehydrogenase family)
MRREITMGGRDEVVVVFGGSSGIGEAVARMMGGARVTGGYHPPAHQIAAYLAKYREGIAGIGMTPEQMGAEYAIALRITPTRAAIHGGDGVPGHAKLAGQLAAWDQMIPWPQAAAGDGATEFLVQLAGQRLPGARIEEQVHLASTPPTWHGQTIPTWTSTTDHPPRMVPV